jgi:hypothetical protein
MELKEIVKEKYGEAARRVITGEGLPADCCSTTSCCDGVRSSIVRSHYIEPIRRSPGRPDS